MSYDRKTEYAVIEVSALRAIQGRSNDQVVDAQSKINSDMISALEELVNAAKAKSLSSSDQVLAMSAVAW